MKRGGDLRRPASEIPILSPVEMALVAGKARCPRDACLASLLYLTGRRIGEITPLRKLDFNRTAPEKISFTTFNEKSFRAERRPPFTIPRSTYNSKLEEYVDRWYERIEPEFSLVGPSGKLLGGYVTDYLDSLRDEDYLFSPERSSGRSYINRHRAYQIIRGLDERLWLHALRHIDFTRLAELHHDDPVAMHRLTFHKNFESTLNYIQTKKKEEKLRQM